MLQKANKQTNNLNKQFKQNKKKGKHAMMKYFLMVNAVWPIINYSLAAYAHI